MSRMALLRRLRAETSPEGMLALTRSEKIDSLTVTRASACSFSCGVRHIRGACCVNRHLLTRDRRRLMRMLVPYGEDLTTQFESVQLPDLGQVTFDL